MRFYYIVENFKVKKRKRNVRERGLDVREGSESGDLDGYGRKDQMHWKVIRQ